MGSRLPPWLRRSLAAPLLLLTASGSILLATTTLVALVMFASSATDAGVRRTVETAPLSMVSTTVTAPVNRDSFSQVDADVRARLAEAYSGLPLSIVLSARSDSYALPGQGSRKTPELTRFAVRTDLREHARLRSGSWPTPATGGTVRVALSEAAARAMDLSPGDEATFVGRLNDEPVRVTVTGVFTLDDPFSDRWAGETLLTRGTEIGDYTTYGPLMVDLATFTGLLSNSSVAVDWIGIPDLRQASPGTMASLAAALTALTEKPGCANCTAYSNLPDMLDRLGTAARVARSTMLVPVLQLLLLAAYALILTARLLTDHRAVETALLRSRGASGVRLAALAAGEALLMAIPCAIAAPLLAAPLLRLVSSLPWIEASGLRPDPSPDATAYAVSAAVALGCAVLLALPAVRGARRTYMEERTARGRGDRRGRLQRAGADIALLAVAALAIWQLRQYGGPVTATSGGGLGIDPLIVTGPALALLCGGMIGLRLVSPVSRLAERFTDRRRGLAPALGAWQVSRRPLRYSGPALLLTMAVAIGVVSLSTAATWRGSQTDQAAHRAGADLRVAGALDAPELGSLGRGTMYAALPGVTAISPAYNARAEFGGEDATLLALNADRLGELMRLRPDLSAQSLTTLGERLAAGRAGVPAMPLPGEPSRLTVRMRLTVDRPELAETYTAMPVRMVLADGLGVRREVEIGPLRPGVSETSVDVAALAGRSGKVTYPLSVLRFTADVPVPPTGSGFTLAVESVTADDGRRVSLPAGLRWEPGTPDGSPVTAKPAEGVEDGRDLLAVAVEPPPVSRSGSDPVRLTLVPSAGAHRPGVAGPLPVVVTDDLARAERLTAGQQARVTLNRRITEIAVAGIVTEVPGTAADRPAVLVDWEALQERELLLGAAPPPAGEWWIAVRDGDTSAAAEELKRHPEWDQTVVDRSALTAQLRDDPLAGGLQGALILGFAAALVFALIGFLVNAVVAARERTAEFAVLRALGTSFRQILGLLAVEQAFMIGLSLATGTALAVLIARLVVPHIVLTGQATAVTPPVALDIPWAPTAALLAGLAVLLFAIVAVLAAALRRQDLASTLRVGEDR